MKNRHYFKLLLLLLSIFIFFTGKVHAQTFFNIVGSPLDTISCNDTCLLIYTEHLPIKKTTSYSSSSIPFSPYNLTAANNLTLNDDKFSSAISIGFEFCFYGNSYTQCYISSNGHLTFNSNYNNSTCTFQTQTALPYFNNNFPDNAIFMPFVDFNILDGGTISYATVGTAPFRKFIIKYSNIPYFGGVCSTLGTSTMQCELNETYNTIEMHVTSKPICNSNLTHWLNFATMGVQSIGASNYYAVPGKNASIWTANNEAWKIFPNGPNAYHVNWYNEQNALLFSDAETINFCSQNFPRTLHAKITYDCPFSEYNDSIVIVSFKPKILSTALTNTDCKNTTDGAVTINGFSNYPPLKYSIDNGSYVTSNIFNNLSYGSHTISVMDSLGCTVFQSIFINTNSTLAITTLSVTYPICPQPNGAVCVQAIGGVPPYSYIWSNGETTNCIDSVFGGTYTVIVTDSIGCQEIKTISLPAQNQPIINYTIIKAPCGINGGINLSVTGGVPSYTYLWSTGDTTSSVSGLNSGTYSVLVTDNVGCIVSNNITITDTLQVYDTISNIINTHCGLNNGSLSANGFNGVSPYTYLWNNGIVGPTITNLSPGIYTCIVTDASGCTGSVSYNLLASLPLQIQFSKANAHCDSLNNGSIISNVLNASPPLNYLWSNGQNTQSISGLSPIKYILNVTDVFGCTAKDSTTIGNDGSPKFALINYSPPKCYGDTTGFITLSGIDGASPYKYSKDGVLYTTISQLNGISGGSYTLYIRDANSCVQDTVVFFNQPAQLKVTKIVSDTIDCFYDNDASLTIDAIGGYTPYEYQINGSNWQTNNVFSSLSLGVYNITVKDTNDCTASTSHTIVGPITELGVDKIITDVDCYIGHTGKLEYLIKGGWSPYKVFWSHTNSTSLIQQNLTESTYDIQIIDNRGCILNDSSEIKKQDCCIVAFPNAFTPNDDGKNDIFRPISEKEIKDTYIKIYNRWGERVFESDNFFRGWNGKIGEKFADMDTYFYYFTYECNLTGKKVIMKGDVTLLR